MTALNIKINILFYAQDYIFYVLRKQYKMLILET